MLCQGAEYKTLKAPDGSSYFDCAETDEIKSLLKQIAFKGMYVYIKHV